LLMCKVSSLTNRHQQCKKAEIEQIINYCYTPYSVDNVAENCEKKAVQTRYNDRNYRDLSLIERMIDSLNDQT
jgi:hypothetical protein